MESFVQLGTWAEALERQRLCIEATIFERRGSNFIRPLSRWPYFRAGNNRKPGIQRLAAIRPFQYFEMSIVPPGATSKRGGRRAGLVARSHRLVRASIAARQRVRSNNGGLIR